MTERAKPARAGFSLSVPPVQGVALEDDSEFMHTLISRATQRSLSSVSGDLQHAPQTPLEAVFKEYEPVRREIMDKVRRRLVHDPI